MLMYVDFLKQNENKYQYDMYPPRYSYYEIGAEYSKKCNLFCADLTAFFGVSKSKGKSIFSFVLDMIHQNDEIYRFDLSKKEYSITDVAKLFETLVNVTNGSYNMGDL